MLNILRTTLLATSFSFLLWPVQPGITSHAQTHLFTNEAANPKPVITGAERFDKYLPLIKGKSVAIFANQTSMVGNTHLVDTLAKLGVKIKVIFGPEHGFRGNADAGEKIDNAADAKTGIPVVSLYGKKRKPSAQDLRDVDIMLFDIQDVGVRFYTFISSLEDYIEAAIEHKKPLIILDRPNPNGFYVDGPVLEPNFRSFVGMQPVPVVYGMTIGEYAQMLVGEKWIKDEKLRAQLPNLVMKVIPCSGYTHETLYELPVKPSPNLPDMLSIYWYPSTCFFEGTVLSEGRGTEKPFRIFGHPSLPDTLFKFTPTSREGAKSPKLMNQVCYGWNISGPPMDEVPRTFKKLQLNYLLTAYELFPNKDSFFLVSKNNARPEDYFFNKLAGNATFMQQIKEGKNEFEIRKSWQPALAEFKVIRKRYLLYPDFK